MKRNRGCGCLVFVPAAIDVLFSVMAVVSIFSDAPISRPRAWVFVMWALILAANAIFSLVFGLPPGPVRDSPDSLMVYITEQEA